MDCTLAVCRFLSHANVYMVHKAWVNICKNEINVLLYINSTDRSLVKGTSTGDLSSHSSIRKQKKELSSPERCVCFFVSSLPATIDIALYLILIAYIYFKFVFNHRRVSFLGMNRKKRFLQGFTYRCGTPMLFLPTTSLVR